MTPDWWHGDDPARMLRVVSENPDHEGINCVGPRKLRLFACACCRAVWHLLADPRSRRAVEVAERYADGLEPPGRLLRASEGARRAYQAARGYHADGMAEHVSEITNAGTFSPEHVLDVMRLHAMTGGDQAPIRRAQAALLRDVAGDPWAPVALDPAWLARDVRLLATRAYEDRVGPGGGLLDPVRLAVLADALEEAGCVSADLLTHLRSAGPHVRGCWALDLLLGRD